MHTGQTPPRRRVDPPPDLVLRERAAAGLLAGTREDPAWAHLRAPAIDMVCPLVWARHTRKVELAKGHFRCASSFGLLESSCLDGFHDDVEAVVDYMFRYAKQPIVNLEGWITSRMNAATVDGYRHRRGLRGALQRIRVPRWLGIELGDDPWLVTLAGRIIEWVGVPATAGVETWPLDAWSDLRAAVTGELAAPAATAADVDRVLRVMQTSHPSWFATYIERPLGRKPLPVGMRADDDSQALAPGAEDQMRSDRDDAVLAGLAAATADAIRTGLADGCDPGELVPDVVRALFLGAPPAGFSGADDAPTGRDEWLAAVLADPDALARLVRDVLAVVQPQDGMQRHI